MTSGGRLAGGNSADVAASIAAALQSAQAALAPGAIDSAFLFGSVAAGTASPDSDVDVFVIGTARLHQLAPFIDPVEERLGREINIVVHRPAQVLDGFARGKAFYSRVWAQPRRALVGELLQAPVDGSMESTPPG